MTIYNKPDDLPVWAESGDKVQPTNGEIQIGWPNTNVPPSRQRFNWVLNWLMQGVRYLMQKGIPDWDSTEDYPQYARVQEAGIAYKAKVANTNKQPSANPTEWEPWAAGFALNGNVQITANTTLDATHLGKEVRINGSGLTVTLPDAASFAQGSLMVLTNASSVNAVTLARTGSNQFAVDGTGVTSVTLQPGKSLILASQTGSPAYWNAIAGSNLSPAMGSLGGVVVLSTSTTLGATHLGKLIHASGTGVTLNIPRANTVPDGSVIMFQNMNSATPVNLSRQFTDTFAIGGASTATNITLNGGDTVTLIANGANDRWYVADGSASLGNFGAFLASLSANGYQRLPSGLILQWGTSTSQTIVTLPVAFTNADYRVVTNTINSTNSTAGTTTENTSVRTTTQFRVNVFNTAGGITSNQYTWFAIGY